MASSPPSHSFLKTASLTQNKHRGITQTSSPHPLSLVPPNVLIALLLLQFNLSLFSHVLHISLLESWLCKMEQGGSSLNRVVDSGSLGEGDGMELPPGFRFHPTDEELITYYLTNKVLDVCFNPVAIGEVDLNKCEPWELPQRAKIGEKEWYFFCVRDRKYPTGLRTNRATGAGYWKATGKDKEIYRGKVLVGMKKTLVFYRGRAPRGEKSEWVMHEYRLEGKSSILSFPRAAKSEWVLCRVFKKTSNAIGKKTLGTAKMFSPPHGEESEGGLHPPILPPLMDIPAHVTCFSNTMEGQKAHEPDPLPTQYFTSPFHPASANNPSLGISSPFFSKFTPLATSLYGGSFVNLLEGAGMKPKGERLSISQETGLTTDMNPEISSDNEIGRSSFEQCLWNY